jgi:membrane associated rhomboid family serine protease
VTFLDVDPRVVQRTLPKKSSFYSRIIDRINNRDYTFRSNRSNRNNLGEYNQTSGTDTDPNNEDWFLASILQAMEFEIQEDLQPSRSEVDFNNKELRASSCVTQLMTISSFVVVIQIALLVAVIQTYGYAPRANNPMIGPDAQALINFGAKDAGLIIVRGQWWRCISAVFLHAGILHLLSNGIIQVSVRCNFLSIRMLSKCLIVACWWIFKPSIWKY